MRRWLAALVLALPSVSALGEKADRTKPLNYEADSGECDDLKQVCVLVGNVVLNKGTMRAAGERVQVRKDPEGYQSGVIIAAPGKLASFRQRRDSSKAGSEEFVEGYAERIEYDEKEDTVKLITRARVRLLENEVQRDELRGDAITYDQRNAKYFVTGGKPSGDPNNPDGRVRGTIAPRADAPAQASKPASKANLTPSKDLANPRRE
ncbi:MAG TPA: lipopolysaccharide transport periplasmic protein LptA [Burkholderiaceae bacterium]|nr:lipopolysaccharide transport periplasmic protein LptA [Burkholderiaceae bacterium]